MGPLRRSRTEPPVSRDTRTNALWGRGKGPLQAQLRTLTIAGLFVGGLLGGDVVSAPAATSRAADCPIPVGCTVPDPTPLLPSLPTPTVPALPTLPTTPGSGTPPPTETPPVTPGAPAIPSPEGNAAPVKVQNPLEPPRAAGSRALVSWVRVAATGRGAQRSIEIRLFSRVPATVKALLLRQRQTLAVATFRAHAGTNGFRLRVPARTKPGAATLRLAVRSASGETTVVTRALRLPR